LVCLVSGAPQAADRQVDAVFVGDLIDTDHDVGGKVIYFCPPQPSHPPSPLHTYDNGIGSLSHNLIF